MNLLTFLQQRLQEGAKPALQVKDDHDDFQTLSWQELGEQVFRTAAAFEALGVKPGDRIAQVSPNRLEWIVSDLAAYLCQAVHVPIHASLSGQQIAWQIRDCEPSLLLLSGPVQAEKLLALALPDPLPLVSFDPIHQPLAGRPVRHLAALQQAADPSRGEELLRVAVDALHENSLATVLYTSGTTGEPKGVMLSHGNLASNAVAACERFNIEPGDLRLCWLPLSHVFARTADLYTWLVWPDMLMALAESRDTILGDCSQVQPTLINGVPYFFEKVMRFLVDQGVGDTPGAANQLLGGRIRMCCSGGAALPDHVAAFYRKQGLYLVQGYGLTETSPVITVSDNPDKIGSVGQPLKGVEIRIADDGEILTRGPHVMLGYWRREDETAQTIRDGWLATGDLGRIDEEGYLYITGRKKELIVTAAGKNIAPVLLETRLCEDPLIQQAMVVGDGRNYLAALLVIDRGALSAARAAQGQTLPENWTTDETVRAIVAERVKARLADLSSYEQVGRFALLAEPFTPDNGLLTPTLKLRRGEIAQRYADVIETLYTRE